MTLGEEPAREGSRGLGHGHVSICDLGPSVGEILGREGAVGDLDPDGVRRQRPRDGELVPRIRLFR